MKQLRRTMLFVPGNNPGMIRDAGIYDVDSIMFDLEDSVSIDEKDAARFLVYEMLGAIDYHGKELIVRVNSPDIATGVEDLKAMVKTRKVAIRLPKTECAADVLNCEKKIASIERQYGIPEGSTRMMAAIESAAGVLNAKEIAFSTKRLIGIALGAEDYVTDLKTTRSPEGTELLFARCMILQAARAAGIDAIDTVYSNVNNEEGFRSEVALIKQLGFDGKSIINPRQIKPVQEIYTPTKNEIDKSLAIVDAIEEARKRGSGVIALNGKMIDKPIVARAQRVLDLARAAGVLK
ncbi:citrate (pro-3S)-lyase subunit beta [Caproicibacter sp. BJN0012]|uniref:citrate (pro-3S)-lyase subunit beta n=1 Tax=Caproicibacter sp. BJN0012 TaxID=3110227 RepID=UPI002E0FBA19|nr:citrate (pro-3S)-lyase subunit beta [Caproicibacter sp. BJN0012]